MENILSLRGDYPVLIGEVGQAHDGSLGAAHAFIDVIADSGFDAVKFQTHIANSESTLDEPFRKAFSKQDENRFAYWKRMEFRTSEWLELRDHAQSRGLIFLSTPFSLDAFSILKDLDVCAWKIGSGEFKSWDLVNAMIDTGLPILLSTGMSSWQEIEIMAKHIKMKGNDLVLLQCTSQYPTPLERVGLNVLSEFKNRFDCYIGLSDHSGTPWPAVAAMARGVSTIEVHVAMHKKSFGPDVSSSLIPEELRLLSEARNTFAIMNENYVDKDLVSRSLDDVREIFTRSVCLRQDMPAGTILSPKDLTLKKPGGGIPSDALQSLVGSQLLKDVKADRLLSWDDLALTKSRLD